MPNNTQPSPSGDELERLDATIQEQYALEKWWVDDNKARDVEYAEFLMERGRVTSDKGIRSLLVKLAEQLAVEIESRVNANTGKVQRQTVPVLRRLLKDIEPFELAYLVLSTTVNTIMSNTKPSTPFASMSATLADALQDELRMRAMLELEPSLPALVNRVLSENRASIKHRKRVFVNLFHKKSSKQVPSIFTDNNSRMEVGNTLIELLFTPPGVTIAELSKAYDSRTKNVRWVIKPSEKLKKIFYRELGDEFLAKRTTPLGITLYQPGRRAADQPEMLLTRDCPPVKVNVLGGKSRKYQDLLIEECGTGFNTLLGVLTFLEQTPMKINPVMLEYLQQNKEQLQKLGVLDSATLSIPDCPVSKDKINLTDLEEEKLFEWKRLVEKQHNQFHQNTIKVRKQNALIQLAAKLSSYDRFYQRWYADFRGRLYPLNSSLSFQSSSLAKALLEFSEPASMIVGDPQNLPWREFVECGLRLLETHAKLPLEEFEKFYSDRLRMEATAREANPAAFLEIGALKKKNFLPYLAWVLELKRLLPSWGNWARSGHPIRKDATCSSIQHMAALSGDKKILAATNCTGDAKEVKDLYTTIVPNYKDLGLEREWVKGFIMTYAYNSTDFTRQNEIAESFRDKFGMELPRIRVGEITDTLKRAAHKGLGRIPKLQECFMEVFRKLVIQMGLSATSVTPISFVVDSTKYTWPEKRYRIHNLDALIHIQLRDLDSEDAEVNKRKTRQAWVANIIHSLDACLLHIALNGASEAHKRGKNRLHISTIHDCVVTRPGDMRDALLCLGYAFKVMYSPDPSDGLPMALHRLTEYWDLENDFPELYQEFLDNFKAVPSETFDNMRYFFV